MKLIISIMLFSTLITLSTKHLNLAFAADKPVQHLDLPDVTSLEEAKKVFAETTKELQSKKVLDSDELHQIHMTTYSLEKAVAYFAENMEGDKQIEATKMAEVVELVHLASENDRADETRVYLEDYSKRATAFAEKL